MTACLLAGADAGAQGIGPARAELHRLAQGMVAGRLPLCGESRYGLQMLPMVLVFPHDKPALVEFKELLFNEQLTEAAPDSVDRMNDIEWNGSVTLTYKAHRIWDARSRSWRDWRAGPVTGDIGSYPFPRIDAQKRQGVVAARNADQFNRTFFPISCEQARAILAGSDQAQAAARPAAQDAGTAKGEDPAFALARGKVDPAATTITTGGFGGLKVGHTRADAQQFFGKPLEAAAGCASTLETVTPKGDGGVEVVVAGGRILGFTVFSTQYRTRAGLQVGNAEARVVELYGRDSSFERRVVAGQQEIWLGRSGATAMRIALSGGQVKAIAFGSSRILESIPLRC